jgi:tetratricopeptide (TPR) repeat protein/tRNA A-37 threonylcarbamoyl transferase component Bud32
LDAETMYKKGDVIGQKYFVHKVLGAGGFGIVYLVYSHETEFIYALKTFRDEYLQEAVTRKRFQEEAKVWVNLERHPYIVRAYYVEEIDRRLFIVMEYIVPNQQGLNSLDGYLRARPLEFAQSLRWSIQFCYGMEYVYSRGVQSHRDIKPANIMIGLDNTVKISDFGLASVLYASSETPRIKLDIHNGIIGLSGQTVEGAAFGTPTHMAPEQFTNAVACDERSDIYSFGIILYQMVAGGQVPFLASLPKSNAQEEMIVFWRAMQILHRTSAVPKFKSPLFPIIQHCLEKKPANRYQTFKELRKDLESLLLENASEVIKPPELKELEFWEWGNKGISLERLGHHKEAIKCFDRALEFGPLDATTLVNKGNSLNSLGRFEEAIECFDRVISIAPRLNGAWEDKGISLSRLGRLDEAVSCFDKAVELNPLDALTWTNRGGILRKLGRFEEAIKCFNKAIGLEPMLPDARAGKGAILSQIEHFTEAVVCFDKVTELDPLDKAAWACKGDNLSNLGDFSSAIVCYDKAIALTPRDGTIWNSKGINLKRLGRFDEAITCYDKAIELDPESTSIYWYNKGLCLNSSKRFGQAMICFDKAIELKPDYADAYNDKGLCLSDLGRYDEAIIYYDKAIELDSQNAPRYWCNKGLCLSSSKLFDQAMICFEKAIELNPLDLRTWYVKALAEDSLGRQRDAIRSYERFITLSSTAGSPEVEHARQRLRYLEGNP